MFRRSHDNRPKDWGERCYGLAPIVRLVRCRTTSLSHLLLLVFIQQRMCIISHPFPARQPRFADHSAASFWAGSPHCFQWAERNTTARVQECQGNVKDSLPICHFGCQIGIFASRKPSHILPAESSMQHNRSIELKPLIGLTPTPEIEVMDHGTFRRHTLSDHYSRAIIQAGGIPVMLPSNYPAPKDMLDRLDGVVITGGGDIDPARYGQERNELTAGIDEERDAFEFAIFEAAMEMDLPVLGICRGCQLFNVALGGTLYQDMDTVHPDAVEHRQQKLGIHHEDRFQTVTLTGNDHPLATLHSDSTMEVNSFHHQGLDRIASDLVPMATTADGLVEAVYHPGMRYGVAVQWHPELMAHNFDDQAAIFRQFVEVCSDVNRSKSLEKELV